MFVWQRRMLDQPDMNLRCEEALRFNMKSLIGDPAANRKVEGRHIGQSVLPVLARPLARRANLHLCGMCACSLPLCRLEPGMQQDFTGRLFDQYNLTTAQVS